MQLCHDRGSIGLANKCIHLQASSNPARVIYLENHKVHEVLTEAIDDPSRLQHWRGFSKTVLPRYFENWARPSTYPALMLDSTQCWKRRAVWLIMALVISFIAGYLGGGCTIAQHCQLGTAFGIGGVVLSVLWIVQAILLQGTN